MGRLTKLRPVLDNRQNVVLAADTAGLRARLAAHAREREVSSDATRFASEFSGSFHAAAPASAR
jgi:hypothetical protein